MLTLQIENPDLEQYLEEEFHGDRNAMAQRFLEFLELQKIRRDVKASEEELERGESLSLEEAFGPVLEKYGNT